MADFSRQFRLLADYNGWANHRLLDACSQLDGGEVESARPAFFGSILGTLNHILVGDQAWLARLRKDPPPGIALDHTLYSSLPEFAGARKHQDDEITAYVRGLGETDFTAIVTYKNMSGAAFDNTVSDILTHMFNHQTHHRGQVHDMLSQTKVLPPELDYIFFMRELPSS